MLGAMHRLCASTVIPSTPWEEVSMRIDVRWERGVSCLRKVRAFSRMKRRFLGRRPENKGFRGLRAGRWQRRSAQRSEKRQQRGVSFMVQLEIQVWGECRHVLISREALYPAPQEGNVASVLCTIGFPLALLAAPTWITWLVLLLPCVSFGMCQTQSLAFSLFSMPVLCWSHPFSWA